MALPGAGWPPLPLAMSSGPTVMIVILCYQTWDMGAGGGVVNVILILIET